MDTNGNIQKTTIKSLESAFDHVIEKIKLKEDQEKGKILPTVDLSNCSIEYSFCWNSLIKELKLLEKPYSNSLRQHKFTLVDFTNTEFLEEAHFEKAELLCETRFENACFAKNGYFTEAIFGEINFSKATFNSIALFSKMNVRGRAFFDNAIFKYTSFNKTVFNGSVSFLSVVFERQANFSYSQFLQTSYQKESVYFNKSKFNGGVIFFTSIFDREVYFEKVVFLRDIVFEKATFKRFVDFSSAEFIDTDITKKNIGDDRTIYFTNVTFEKEVFFDAIKSKAQTFYFRHATIKGLFTFNLKKTDSEDYLFKLKADFQRINIGVNSYFKCNNLNKEDSFFGEMDFSEALVEGRLDFEDVYLEKLCLDKMTLIGNVTTYNLEIKEPITRRTAILLKQAASKIHDAIGVIRWNREELKAYRKELKWRKNPFNKFLLVLNRISNNYGASWLLGAGFTVGVAIFFYTIAQVFQGSNISGNYENFVQNWKEIFQYLFSFNFNFEFSNINYDWNLKALIVLIVGKVFIGYGIYQTIAAFRKFRFRS